MTDAIRTPTPEQRGREMLKANGYGSDPWSADPGYVPKKRGGKVAGKHAKGRPDKRARGGGVSDCDEPEAKRASGGATPHKGKHPAITVNIKTGAGAGEKQAAAQQGMRAGAAMAAGAGRPPMPPPHPPMAGPPMGGAPMAGGPPRPPMGPPMAGPGMPPPGAMAKHGGEIPRDRRTGRFTGGAV